MLGWFTKHWKTIAVVAVSTLAFVAVAALTAGLGAAPMAALLAGGFSSGVAGYVTARRLDDQAVHWQDALLQGATAGAITVATAGLGGLVTPVLSRTLSPVLAPFVSEAALPLLTRTVANSAAGAALGGGTAVLENSIAGRPLTQGVKQAAIFSAATGAFIEPLQRTLSFGRSGPLGVRPNDQPLTHLTSADGEAGIRASGELRGNRGVFAVPERAASEDTLAKVARTGLDPRSTTHAVSIPETAEGLFVPAKPFGPYSALKWAGGVRYAPAGSIDIASGAFVPSGGQIGPGALIYGPDIAILYAGSLAASAARAKASDEKVSSPGFVNVLGNAVK